MPTTNSMLPIILHTRRFPPKKFIAITLFPFIFYNSEQLGDTDLRHETVHIWQQLALLIIPFYILYLSFWILGLIRHKSLLKAYKNIPFEISAYKLESQHNTKKITQAFHWVKCIKKSLS